MRSDATVFDAAGRCDLLAAVLGASVRSDGHSDSDGLSIGHSDGHSWTYAECDGHSWTVSCADSDGHSWTYRDSDGHSWTYRLGYADDVLLGFEPVRCADVGSGAAADLLGGDGRHRGVPELTDA